MASDKHDSDINLDDIADTDIAIVGIGIRAPGARDHRAFWKNLQGGVESIRQYTDEELLAAGEDPASLRRPNYVRAGAPLDGLEMFDGEFFGFSPKESAILDPQHRHFLETAWEALEDAGHPPETIGGPVGVFAGCGMGSYFYFNICTNPELVSSVGMFLLRHTGNDKDFLSTRASFLFNLTGPSVNVQTACSTSLVAIHLACQSLLAGECDFALAGGATIEVPHRRGYLFKENEILSPDGHCHAFDHQAKGTVFGSGAGVVVLRPLKAALKDGDHIHAVIRGSAINNDGAGKAGYLAPSVDGQAAAVVEALGIAGVDADSVGYIECHGTGTYLGDPIEVAALTRAYRQSTDKSGFCGIGSVKTNIGHTDTAAGVIGLTKAALALEHGQIPPSLNFDKPNPTIDFAGSPFFVNASLRQWKRGATPRRAGVNSLGVGGTNAHVVLEEPPARPAPAASKAAYQLICLSARNRGALDEGCERLAAHLQAHPEISLADVAYTLKVGRRAFGKRRVLAAADRDEAIALLRGRPDGRVFNHAAVEGEPALYFMLPGGGAQYVNMAKGLYESEPLFRKLVDEGLGYLQSRIDYDAKAVLFPPAGQEAEAAKRYQKPSVQLPAIFIIEYALAKLLLARGITPKGLIGHSLGENTAAALAEVFTFEQGVGLVHLRGTLFDTVPAGGMLSVPMAREQLEPLLAGDPHLDLACINSPGLCVVSGPKEPLAAFQAKLATQDVQAQRINIDIAAHSRMLEGILEPFRAYLKTLPLRAPKLPFISNRSGTWITNAEATDPEYWVRHLRHTVHFAEGVRTLASDKSAGTPVFLEVGPGKTLGSLAKQNPAVNAQNVVSSLRHPEEKVDDRAFFQTVLGRLWALGVPLGTEALWPGEKRRRLPLPTYAFQGQRYWIDPGKAVAAREAPGLPVKIEDRDRWFWAPAWRRLDPAGDADIEAEAGTTSGATPATPPSWMVFLDDTGVGQKLVAELRAQNQEVITVQAGDAFYKVSDREYWLNPEQGDEGYQALIHDVMASGRAPSRIVHLWLLAEGETFRPGSSFFHRNQERGFYSLLFLAQALSGQDYPRPLHVSVVSSGMQRVGSEPLSYPDMSTVLGPVKVLPREMPGVTCSSIDLPAVGRPEGLSFAGALDKLEEFAGPIGAKLSDIVDKIPRSLGALGRHANGNGHHDGNGAGGLPAELAAQWPALLAELKLPASNDVVALRADGRWVERHERTRVPAVDDKAETPALRQGGVYMITGGLGGIGAAMSRLMARELKARLVLIARTPLPDRSEWARFASRNPNDPATARIRVVEQLEAAGAEVMVAAGDVADADRMTEIVNEVKQRFGALHGVIHAAGVLDDGLIPTKRQAQIEGVFGPKVHGTLVLDQVLREEPLDFFVLFSSTSAAIASAGQVDYVAANTFLNSFAKQARASSGGARKVVSVGWGIWSEVGMAASAARKMGLHPGTEPEGPITSASYPLFQEKRVQPRRGGVLAGTLQAKRAWMLDEHRTAKARAVLPGTGYLELLRASAREVGETGPFEIEDLFFFRPLEVADDASLEFRVRLAPSDEGYRAEVQTRHRLSGGENNENGRVEGTGPGRGQGWLLHAQANLRFGHLAAAPGKLDLAAVYARCPRRTAEDPRGLRSKQEEHLNFGPRWRVLHQACYGDGEALGKLALPEKFRSDLTGYGLHPALLDLATGFALPLAPGYREDGSKDLWVPLSYKRVKVHADLTPEVQSWVRLTGAGNKAGFVSFDVTIAAPDGRVLVEVEGFTMRRLAESDFAAPKPLTASDLELEGQVRERELSAAEAAFQHGLSQGITPAEGWRALKRVLAQVAGDPTRSEVLVSSMDLKALIHQAGQVSAAQSAAEPETKFARPQLESEYLAPRTEIEKTLVGFWEGLLGVNQIGVRDSFFELGGHSLIAVRLFAKIRKTYDVDYPISVLFEAPTIEACARLIAQTVGDTPAAGAEAAAAGATSTAAPAHKTRYTHLVPMQAGSGSKGDKLPFFLVAGMFGNVLNLRHLAELVGSDRPFYGLQARGLYGDHQPHETFEEMARDYIAELRTVQPHGPYLLGGFSGGGITAYEMARQLAAEGESVPLIVMLDTPLPKDDPLTLRDKLAIHQQNWGKQGPKYALEWWKSKQAWKKQLAEREDKRQRQQTGGAGHDFHSHVIEAAFYGAVARYDLQAMPFHIALYRPRLRPAHNLGPGRAINADRRRIYHDNGWAPFVRRVEVFEMPGDHDSMVLEPNVRVLAARLRDSLDAAETSPAPRAGNGHGNGTGATAAAPNGNNGATSAEAAARRPSPAAPV